MSPRSREDNEQVRRESAARIRKAALELFSTRGFHQTSISEIAKKAGVSKGLMYNYYDSKEALLHAILYEVFEGSEDFMRQLEQIQDPLEKVQTTLHYTFKMIEERTQEARMLIGLMVQPDAVALIKEQTMQLMEGMVVYFTDLLEKLGVDDSRTETYLLVAELDGLAMDYLFFSSDKNYPWEAMKKRFTENLIKRLQQ